MKKDSIAILITVIAIAFCGFLMAFNPNWSIPILGIPAGELCSVVLFVSAVVITTAWLNLIDKINEAKLQRETARSELQDRVHDIHSLRRELKDTSAVLEFTSSNLETYRKQVRTQNEKITFLEKELEDITLAAYENIPADCEKVNLGVDEKQRKSLIKFLKTLMKSRETLIHNQMDMDEVAYQKIVNILQEEAVF